MAIRLLVSSLFVALCSAWLPYSSSASDVGASPIIRQHEPAQKQEEAPESSGVNVPADALKSTVVASLTQTGEKAEAEVSDEEGEEASEEDGEEQGDADEAGVDDEASEEEGEELGDVDAAEGEVDDEDDDDEDEDEDDDDEDEDEDDDEDDDEDEDEDEDDDAAEDDDIGDEDPNSGAPLGNIGEVDDQQTSVDSEDPLAAPMAVATAGVPLSQAF